MLQVTGVIFVMNTLCILVTMFTHSKPHRPWCTLWERGGGGLPQMADISRLFYYSDRLSPGPVYDLFSLRRVSKQ